MDLISKKVVLGSVILLIALILLFNHGLKRHHDHEALVHGFDIYEVKELFKPHVTIAHKYRAEEKIKTLKSDCGRHLQVILDFDKTLSKYRDENGVRVKSTHELFDTIESVPQGFKQSAGRLYNMYGPVESDPTISVQDKIPFMEQWVDEYQQLVRGIQMNNSLIEKAVRKNNLVLRDGTEELFGILKDSNVPVLIFSAGLGDVVKAALRVHNLTMPNIHVVSNFFTYNDGKIFGFKGRHIHAFNKDQRILENIDFKYAKELKGRLNVILVGDSLGDARMGDGLPYNSTILSIGFLNDKVEEGLAYYSQQFDIVTIKDETMNVTNAVLRKIIFS